MCECASGRHMLDKAYAASGPQLGEVEETVVMRRSTKVGLASLYALLSACQLASPRARPVVGPVYDHVPCNTPGALREQAIDPAVGASKPGNANSKAAAREEERCVVERRFGRT